MKALRVWEGDMLKRLKTHRKKRFVCSALTEGVLGFHHILLRAGAATTAFQASIRLQFSCRRLKKSSRLRSFSSHIGESELKEMSHVRKKRLLLLPAAPFFLLPFSLVPPHSISVPLPFPLCGGPQITPHRRIKGKMRGR